MNKLLLLFLVLSSDLKKSFRKLTIHIQRTTICDSLLTNARNVAARATETKHNIVLTQVYLQSSRTVNKMNI